ncbi:lipopolysaccharide biosynthesis protein [Blastococcus xanthinilyticus]|uniref:O-antigen/teichoic acid export membrane protein n=1 Tax=Blastococcus xanthinilyticus TaxID=1564164 RepID=A0A5S5CXF9_9ACTN|nr:hypothetical protein [Blastococcus xanthinilyticus]TYP87212.1 O-antigen/teichoic acid export membrane protein [Blastococcus xanthinilyticus]
MTGGGPLRRLALHDPLFRNGFALVLNVGLTTLLGVAFWVVAARQYTAEDVGRGSALVAALLLLSNIGQLGLANGLVRFLPAAGAHGAGLLRRGYAFSALASACLGAGFALLAPALSPELAFLGAGPVPVLAFASAVVVWSVFALQDAAIIGLRRAVWIPVENSGYGLLKLALLLPLAVLVPGVGVFVAWVLAAVVLLGPVNAALFRRWLPRHAATADTDQQPVHRLRDLLRFITFDYAGQVCFMAATSALPLLVVALLGAASNAHFYIAWTIAVSLDLLSVTLTQSLTVEAALRPARLPDLLRRLLPRLVLLQAGAVTVLLLGAPLVLSLYGPGYEAEATTPLRLLALAVLPRAVVVVTIAVLRVRRRTRRILAIQAVTGAGVLGLAAVLAGPWGLTGVTFAWLATQTVLALVLLPALARLVRAGTGAPAAPLSPAPEPVGPRSGEPA